MARAWSGRYGTPMATGDDARARGVSAVAVECRRESYEDPHGERHAHDLDQPRMLRQPRTDTPIAYERPGRASAGVDPAPHAWPAGPPGEHVIQMHHELVVRDLIHIPLVKDSLVETLTIGVVGIARAFPRLPGIGLRDRDRRRLDGLLGVWEHRGGRRIKNLWRAPGKARFTAPQRSRRCALSFNVNLDFYRRDWSRRRPLGRYLRRIRLVA